MVKILREEKNRLSLVLEEVGNAYANALRKSANELPILAVDTVEISKNDSALFDEMLAHRVGLVPLKSDKTFTLPEDCTCKGKGCAKCTVALTLKASGSGMINSSEIQSKTVSAIYPETPLVFLQKDQEVELVAEARMGKGIDHAKHSPGLVWVRAAPHIQLPKDVSECRACAEACPREVYKIEPKIEVKNIMNCDMCMACVEECDKHSNKDKIKVWGDEKDFIIEVESWGQLTPKEILLESGDALKKNIDEFLKEASKLK